MRGGLAAVGCRFTASPKVAEQFPAGSRLRAWLAAVILTAVGQGELGAVSPQIWFRCWAR
jgi:hypothetical protein